MFPGNCSVVIPARNEESAIRNCCSQLAYNNLVAEIIVVANNCDDMTASKARKGGAKVIEVRKGGKGHAVSLGVRQASQHIIVLCDGDLKNPSPAIIDALLKGMATPDVKLVKGSFDRNCHPGPVTDILVRPVLQAIGHPAMRIQQPLSGMIAVNKEFICGIELPNDYGMDLTILLAAYENGLEVSEAELPPIEHRERPWSHYKSMATEVVDVLMKFGIINQWKGSK